MSDDFPKKEGHLPLKEVLHTLPIAGAALARVPKLLGADIDQQANRGTSTTSSTTSTTTASASATSSNYAKSLQEKILRRHSEHSPSPRSGGTDSLRVPGGGEHEGPLTPRSLLVQKSSSGFLAHTARDHIHGPHCGHQHKRKKHKKKVRRAALSDLPPEEMPETPEMAQERFEREAEQRVMEQDAAVVIQRQWRGRCARVAAGCMLKAQRALRELYETEKTYATLLLVTSDYVFEALRDHGPKTKVSSEVDLVLVTLSELLGQLTHLHVEVLAGLEAVRNIGSSPEDWRKGETIDSAMRKMTKDETAKMYSLYCTSYDSLTSGEVTNTLQVVADDPKAREIVRAAVQEAADDLSADGVAVELGLLELHSLLILPVQRLPRYLMLLGEAMKAYNGVPKNLLPSAELPAGSPQKIKMLHQSLADVVGTLNNTKRLADQRMDAMRVAFALGLDSFLLAGETFAVSQAIRANAELSDKSFAKAWDMQSNRAAVAASGAGPRSFLEALEKAQEAPNARDFVEEIALEWSSSATEKKAKAVRALVFTDLIVLTKGHQVAKGKDSKDKRAKVLLVLDLEDLSRVAFLGDRVELVEERRTPNYPFILSQTYFLRNPVRETKPMTSFHAADTVAFSSVVRFFQALIPCLPGSCRVAVDAADPAEDDNVGGRIEAAGKAAIAEVVAARGTLSGADWKAIVASGSELTRGRGETLVRQGSMFAGLFVVQKGIVGVYKGTLRIAELSTGDYFGELSLVTGEAGATVSVYTESATVVRVSPVQLLDVLSTAPSAELAENFFRMVVNSLSVRTFHAPIVEQLQSTSGKKDDEIKISAGVANLRRQEEHLLEKEFLAESSGEVEVSQRPGKVLASTEHKNMELARLFGCPNMNFDAEEFGGCQMDSIRGSVGKRIGDLVVLGAGLGFSGKYFGFSKRDFISWKEVTRAELHTKKSKHMVVVVLAETSRKMKFTFPTKEVQQAASGAMMRAQRVYDEATREDTDFNEGVYLVSSDERDPWELSARGWLMLQSIATSLPVSHEDQVLVRAGQVTWPPKVWQISSGKARVQLGNGTVLGYLHPQDVVGEMSFLFGGAARATVVTIGSGLSDMQQQSNPQSALTSSQPVDLGSKKKTRVAKSKSGEPGKKRSTFSSKSGKRFMQRARRASAADVEIGATETSVLELSRPKLHELFEEQPETVVRFYRSIAQQLAARMLESHKQ